MALLANALVTVQRAKDFIQPGGMTASDDARLEEVINRCSSAIEHHIGRRLIQVTYVGVTAMRVTGPCWGSYVEVPHSPINTAATVTVTLNGSALTVWRSEADGDPASYDAMVESGSYPLAPLRIFRASGWHPTSYPKNVKIEYTGGWLIGQLPKDVEEAALEIIKLVWNDQSKGLQDVTTVNLSGGGFTVFSSPFPRRALQLLEPYMPLQVA